MALRGLQTEGANRTTRSEGQIYPQFSVGWRPPNLNYYHPIMYEYSNATALFP